MKNCKMNLVNNLSFLLCPRAVRGSSLWSNEDNSSHVNKKNLKSILSQKIFLIENDKKP